MSATYVLDDLSPSMVKALATIRRCVLNADRNWISRSEVHWGSVYALADRGLVSVNSYRSVVRLTAKGEPLAEQARLFYEEGIWPGDES